MKIFNTLNFFTATIFILFLSSVSYSQLSGIYSIGTGGDFATITSAVTALNINGVNGPVIFNIKTGSYNEAVTIDSAKVYQPEFTFVKWKLTR